MHTMGGAQHVQYPPPLPLRCHAELAKLLGNRTRALLTFEDPSFTVEGFLATYLGQLSEKAIGNARQDLGALLATCTEEVRAWGSGVCGVRWW